MKVDSAANDYLWPHIINYMALCL